MPTLWPAQVEAVDWITKRFREQKGVLLADRMGLGKTAPAIEVLKACDGPVLIICPAYLICNWLEELELWGAPVPHVIDAKDQIIEQAAVYIIGYSRLANDHLFKQLLKKKYSLIICDEAHYLKAWNSIRARRVLGTHKNKQSNLLFKAQNILLLTGTPIINRIEEIYNLIGRIAPAVLSQWTREQFIVQFSAWWQYTAYGLKHSGVKNEALLKSLLSKAMLAREFIEDLPDRIDKTFHIELKGAELKKYISEEAAFLSLHNIRPDEIIDAQTLKKQDMTRLQEIRQQAALFKIPFVIEALGDVLEKVETVVVYTYHRSTQIALHDAIKKKFKQTCGIINGSVAMREREDILKKFRAGEIQILLPTIGALREGVNITSTNVVLFVEYDWTPANMEQAIARLHRRKQTETVLVYFFAFTGGIDKYMENLLKIKRNTIQKVMSVGRV